MNNRPALPHALRLIAEAAGEEAALALALGRRGTRLRIPRQAEGSQLADIVGIDAARAIVESLADEVIEFPLARKALAFRLREAGWTVERIANRLGIAPRTLRYWFTDTMPSGQFELFR